MKPVILDMDPGVDDALALLIAFRSPELDIKAVTVTGGNVGVDLCLKNTFRVLDILEIPEHAAPPIARGSSQPLKRDPLFLPSIHGNDGLGGLERFVEPDGRLRYPEPIRLPSKYNAVDIILSMINEYKDKLTIVATGPTTNIAKAIIEDSKTVRKIGNLIIMAGAFTVPGNITPVAEFNAFFDPDALQIILDSGLDSITIVGLDVTHQVRLLRDYAYSKLKAKKTKLNQFVVDCTEFYMDFYFKSEGFDGCYLHDPLAVGVAICPELVESQELFVQVETVGRPALGATIADIRPRRSRIIKSNARVCLDVNAEKFLQLFSERVLD
jgi:purine nucleosidase/pyrimidine-specific ribonucleoside hydrolase